MKDEEGFPPELSSVTDLRRLLHLVFSTETAIDEWLSTPDPSLGGQSPRQTALRPGGLQRVRELIVRMIHGVP